MNSNNQNNTQHQPTSNTHHQSPSEVVDKYKIMRNGKVCGNLSITRNYHPDRDIIYQRPFSHQDYMTIIQPYLDKSPFFTRLVKEKYESLGEEEFMRRINNMYKSCYYKKGSAEFFRDYVLGTRRRRDEFVYDMNVTSGEEAVAEAEVSAGSNGVEENQEEKEENVTFTDHRESVHDQGFITNQITTTQQSSSMQEQQWHVRNIMRKPILTHMFEWSTTQTIGTTLLEKDLPGDFLSGPHYNLAATFTFFRAEAKIRIQLNSNKFQSGMLIAAFVPRFSAEDQTESQVTTSTLMVCPHVFLVAGQSNSGILHIPFSHQNSYFNTYYNRPYQSLGRLIVRVFNQLGASDGSSKVADCAVWTAWENCELHQPCTAHQVQLPKAAVLKQAPTAEAGVEGLVKAAAPLITSLINPGISTTSGNVGGASSNCDKPTDPTEIQRWVPNTVSSLNFGEGLDRSNRLSLLPGTATTHEPSYINTTRDDMDLKLFCKIPVRNALIEWSTSDAAGKRLITIPMTPSYCGGGRQAGEGSVVIYSMTPLSWSARAFKYFRGGLKVWIQVLPSLQHTGRLEISYGAAIKASQLTDANYLNTFIMDIQEKHELEFIVPYLAEQNWLRCDKILASAPEINTSTQILGYLNIHVINRLSCPDTVAQKIDINVYVTAADDLEFAFPSDLLGIIGTGSIVPAKKSIAPQREKDDEKPVAESALTTENVVSGRNEEGTATMTAGGALLRPIGKETMSENAMNLKNVLRRYYLTHTTHTVLDGRITVFKFPNTPDLAAVNKRYVGSAGYGIQFRTQLAHFSEPFTFWRGSLRYKLVYTVTNTHNPVIFNVFHVPGSTEEPDLLGTTSDTGELENVMMGQEACGTMSAINGIQGSLEFEIPFYTPFNQLQVQEKTLSSLSATGTVYIIAKTNTQQNITFDLYQAAGDDFALNYLRFIPSLQFPTEKVEAVTQSVERWRSTEYNARTVYRDPFNPPVAEALVETVRAALPRNPYTHTLNTLNSIEQTAITATQTLTSIQRAANRLGVVEETTDTDAEEPDMFRDLAGFLTDIPALAGLSMKMAVKVASLVTGFNAFCTATTIFNKACALITIINELLGPLIQRITTDLWNFVNIILGFLNGNKQGNQLPLAEADILDFVPALVGTVTVALVAIGFKSIPNDKETQNIVADISNKLRLFNFSGAALGNAKSLYREMKDLVQWIIDSALTVIAPELLANLKLQRGFAEIEQFAAFIDEVETYNYVSQSCYDAEFRKAIGRLGTQARVYNQHLITAKIGREASIVREYVRKALEIESKVKDAINGLPSRIDPFCVCIFGTTNIGKSAVIQFIGNAILNNLNYPNEPGKRWVSLNASEKFFTEDYDYQTALYIDDMSTFTTPEQYENFHCLKNNNKFPLNLPFSKGKCFNSDFIFATTNSPYPRPNCVTNLPALWRRRNILIEGDYLNEDIAQRIAQGDYEARNLDFTYLRFRIRDPNNAAEIGQDEGWMNITQLINHCTEQARTYMTNQYTFLCHALKNAKVIDDLIPEQKAQSLAGALMPEEEQHREEEFVDAQEVHLHAESATLEVFDEDKIQKDPRLSLYDPEIFRHLIWNEQDKKYTLEATEDDYLINEWNTYTRWRDGEVIVQSNYDLILRSYRKSPLLITLKERLMEKLSTFKQKLIDTWNSAKQRFSWLEILESWPAKLTGSLLALIALGGLTVGVVRKCVCISFRHWGYRCPMCGRWPKLENVRDHDWMLAEWAKLYGPTRKYEEGRITKLQEEQHYFELSGSEVPTKPLIGTKEAEAGPYSQDVRGMRMTRVIAQGTPYQQDTKGQKTTTVIANNSQLSALLEHRLCSYIYRLKRVFRSGQIIGLNGFAIGGRRVLISGHFFSQMHDGEIFSIYHSGAWMDIIYHTANAIAVPNKDCIVYEMPIQFHQHKNMTKHFIPERELPLIHSTSAILVQLDSSLNTTIHHTKATAMKQLKYQETSEGIKRNVYVQGLWSYPGLRGAGMCGSVLLADHDKLSGRIIGLHVAGSGGSGNALGYSQLITREMIEPFITAHLGTPLPEVTGHIKKQIVPEGHIGYVGQTARPVMQPTKTEIIPTQIHGIISPPETFPSVLRNDDKRLDHPTNILMKGIAKFSHTGKPFNERHRGMIKEFWHRDAEQWDLQRDPQPLTDTEAIGGIPLLEGYERINLQSSPGYPYVLSKPREHQGVLTKGKAYLFTWDTLENLEQINYAIADDQLRKNFDMRERLGRMGERVVSVWTCCLKDERRPLPKIQSGSTRLFIMPPVDLTLITRKYTLDFAAAVRYNRMITFNKVGIDPQSLEWTQIHQQLTYQSDKIIAGDFGRFDGSVPADLTEDFYQFINEWYEKNGICSVEDKRMRMVLCDEAVHTVCLAKDEVFVTHCGNKSGDPLTVIKNGYINCAYMGLAWLHLAEIYAPECATMESFQNHVKFMCYGDDNLLAVDDSVLPWYNQSTISEFLAHYGIEYTNAEKTGVTPYTTIDKATFLKNGFKAHESLAGVIVPIMTERTIFELLNWTRTAPDQDQLLRDNCNDALRFAYFYGFDYFQALREKIVRALKSQNIRPNVMTYSDFHFWFLYVCGMMPKLDPCEAESVLEAIASSGNGIIAQRGMKIIQSLPYKILSLTGLLLSKQRDEDRTDTRYAIAIPSGEGKSWLCNAYPHLFVDHDDILLPEMTASLHRYGLDLSRIMQAYEKDLAPDDRRVLLVHHPNDTKRQIIGSFKLPKPSFIRANTFQRLRMEGVKMERDQRNKYILELIKQLEPQLFRNVNKA